MNLVEQAEEEKLRNQEAKYSMLTTSWHYEL